MFFGRFHFIYKYLILWTYLYSEMCTKRWWYLYPYPKTTWLFVSSFSVSDIFINQLTKDHFTENVLVISTMISSCHRFYCKCNCYIIIIGIHLILFVLSDSDTDSVHLHLVT